MIGWAGDVRKRKSTKDLNARYPSNYDASSTPLPCFELKPEQDLAEGKIGIAGIRLVRWTSLETECSSVASYLVG